MVRRLKQMLVMGALSWSLVETLAAPGRLRAAASFRAWTAPLPELCGAARGTHMARRQAPRSAAWESRKRGEARRGGSGGPMQDAENVAAPEAAEQRAEPGQQQQPAAEPPPPGEEPSRPTGPGAQEAAGGEDAEAGPEPDVPAEPAADGEERAASAQGSSPPPLEEPPASAPAAGEVAAEQAGDPSAEARSEGAGGEDGGADEPSFSDPEDFVDDVSEEGEVAREAAAAASPRPRCRPGLGKGF